MSDLPRLLLILPGAQVGGIERYGLTIGLAAASQGWEVHAAFPRTAANTALIDGFREGAVTTHALDNAVAGPSLWELATVATRTTRVVARARPDVVQVNVPLLNFGRGHLIGCAVCGVPTVTVFHMTPPDGLDLGRSRRLYPLLRIRNQTWMATSEHDRSQIAGAFGVPSHEVALIRNGPLGPPASGEPPSADEALQVRRELGLPSSALVALSAGRLSKQKGYDHLISVAARAAERYPQVHFVIAGEGEERDALESLIRERRLESNVHLIGQRSDVERLMRAADLFLLPSRMEGFPFVLLEALAHGLPIIASDIAGVDEIVGHRDSALMHPAGDTESLWRWLEFAIQHPEEMRAMGERAKLASDRFSQDEMVESTLALLLERSRR